MFKIQSGVKKVKEGDKTQDEFTGKLKKDAKLYMKNNKKEQPTLKGIFLKEKITSNTVIKKIKDIILLFDESHHGQLLIDFEQILGYKIDVL